MNKLQNIPPAGLAVITIIAALFALALVLLFHVYLRYKFLTAKADGEETEGRGFRGALLREYIAAYKKYGRDVNTPAIISDVVSTRLSGLLLCERFLNNAVSLFVTLGLFGTFLGLSMSVTSLTELISYSNTEEWLSVLDSVGGGLMSALSGMGVAFYTSLAGAGASILLTVLRTVFSPAAQRDKMETRLELWLDTEIAPNLATDAAKDDAELVKRMVDALNGAAEDFRGTLTNAAAAFTRTTDANRAALADFDRAIETFKGGVHDFGEVDYNLRGSVERMDLAVRDLSAALREVKRRMEGAGT